MTQTTPPNITAQVWNAIGERLEMRDRHIKEQAREDLGMKILFALMCPPLSLFPSFWRN